MIFASRIIIDNNNSKNRKNHPPASIPDRPSMFYDKTLCEEFSKNFPFNFPLENEQKDNNKQLIKKWLGTQIKYRLEC